MAEPKREPCRKLDGHRPVFRIAGHAPEIAQTRVSKNRAWRLDLERITASVRRCRKCEVGVAVVREFNRCRIRIYLYRKLRGIVEVPELAQRPAARVGRIRKTKEDQAARVDRGSRCGRVRQRRA